MVRLFPLSLLAVFAGAALAGPTPDQQVLGDGSALLANKWSYSDCGTRSDLIVIKSIKLSPDPPEPGQDLTVMVSGTAVETIEEGAYADVTVKLGIIKLLTKQFDICKEARAANISLQCPVEQGDHTVSHTVKLPREIPPAKFAVEVKGYTNEDKALLCLKLNIDFSNLPFFGVW